MNIDQLSEIQKQRLAQVLLGMEQLRLSGKDLGLTYKQITHWNKEGIFLREIEEGRWHSFRFVESLWVLLALELRSYGFSLEEIRHYKKYFGGSDILDVIPYLEKGGELINTLVNLTKGKVEGMDFNMRQWIKDGGIETVKRMMDTEPDHLYNLHTHALYSMIRPVPYTLAFAHGGLRHLDWEYQLTEFHDESGQGLLGNKKDVLHHIMSTSGVVISLDHLISRLILIEPKFKKNRKPLTLFLTEGEQEIIQQLRDQSDYLSVKIDFQDREPVVFHFEHKADPARITEFTTLIRKFEYADIELKYVNGHIVHAVKTTHIKVPKK